MSNDDIIHFGKILKQSAYKFINLIGQEALNNTKLYLLLPKYSYYEILTAMAEYFIQDTEASEIIINHFIII